MGWQWIAFAIAVVVMLAGVVGTLIPALPGLPIVFLAMLGYAVVDGFRDITPGFLAVALLVVAATQVAEHYARLGSQAFRRRPCRCMGRRDRLHRRAVLHAPGAAARPVPRGAAV